MLPPKRTLHRHEIPGTARFLTFSCFRRLPLFNNEIIRDRFVEHLVRVAAKPGVDVLAWVIMPEHVHLVLALEDIEAESLLRSLKRPFSSEVLARWREIGTPLLAKLRDRPGTHHFWQKGGGYDRNVISDELLEKIRYCHRNPITRGLVQTSVDWKWSSARAYENREDAIGPTINFDLLPRGSKSLT